MQFDSDYSPNLGNAGVGGVADGMALVITFGASGAPTGVLTGHFSTAISDTATFVYAFDSRYCPDGCVANVPVTLSNVKRENNRITGSLAVAIPAEYSGASNSYSATLNGTFDLADLKQFFPSPITNRVAPSAGN